MGTKILYHRKQLGNVPFKDLADAVSSKEYGTVQQFGDYVLIEACTLDSVGSLRDFLVNTFSLPLVQTA